MPEAPIPRPLPNRDRVRRFARIRRRDRTEQRRRTNVHTGRDPAKGVSLGPRGSYKKTVACPKCRGNGYWSTEHRRSNSTEFPFNPKGKRFGRVQARPNFQDFLPLPWEEDQGQPGPDLPSSDSAPDYNDDTDSDEPNDHDEDGEGFGTPDSQLEEEWALTPQSLSDDDYAVENQLCVEKTNLW